MVWTTQAQPQHVAARSAVTRRRGAAAAGAAPSRGAGATGSTGDSTKVVSVSSSAGS